MNDIKEDAFTFSCNGSQLLGIIHKPEDYLRHGVLIVVGGPQYRAGSHRQFTLLSRYLAEKGIAAMRFDYRGMGDSEGEERSFEDIDSDIDAAISVFLERAEQLESVVIWGLCDAASAALFKAPEDSRISGLVLLNPWVRSESGAAKTYIKHYYLQRLFDRELWMKLIRGNFDFSSSMASLIDMIRQAFFKPAISGGVNKETIPFQQRMLDGFGAFTRPVLLILSGNQDYVADEFRDLTDTSAEWKSHLGRDAITRIEFPQANHTFSRMQWRDQVAEQTAAWISNLDKTNS